MPDAHSALAHQFDDLEQQHEVSTLGIWVFLATEVILFGGAFTGYTAYRSAYPQGFAEGSRHTDVVLGSVNTLVLITSSLTMALAVHGAQLGRRKTVIAFLVFTILLGSVFLGIKSVEYFHKFQEHLIPGHGFRSEGAYPRQAELFMCFYFALTGLHALHMLVGISILSVIIIKAYRGQFSPGYYNPVEVGGLYWHFVDIVWIFLFPLLYLIDRHH